MKFFKKYDRTEGENYEPNIFIAWGRQFRNNDKDDGWFIKLEFPLTLTKKYTNSKTFELETGLCRYHLLYRRRPNGNHYSVNVWQPIKI